VAWCPIGTHRYAPNVLRINGTLWLYTIAKPSDGRPWEVTLARGASWDSLRVVRTVLTSNTQPWEDGSLFYPYVPRCAHDEHQTRIPSPTHTQIRTRVRTHTRSHACTHAHTHTPSNALNDGWFTPATRCTRVKCVGGHLRGVHTPTRASSSLPGAVTSQLLGSHIRMTERRGPSVRTVHILVAFLLVSPSVQCFGELI
jgi:hypothetical protein